MTSPCIHNSGSGGASNTNLSSEETLQAHDSSAQLGNMAVEEVRPDMHSQEARKTYLDNIMEGMGNPVKTLGEAYEGLKNVGNDVCQSILKVIEPDYRTSLEEMRQLKEIHLARQPDFSALNEDLLFNNLTRAFDAVLEAPGSRAAQHHLWNLIEEAERKVPTTTIETELPPPIEATVSNNQGPQASEFADVIHSSQSALDNDPQDSQQRFTNLFQLRALYLGVLQKVPVEGALHEECQRLVNHFEMALGKGSRLTDYDYRILIVHKNWFRDWVSSSSEVVNGASYLPNEDVAIPKAQLVGYNPSQT